MVYILTTFSAIHHQLPDFRFILNKGLYDVNLFTYSFQFNVYSIFWHYQLVAPKVSCCFFSITDVKSVTKCTR